MAFVPLQQDSQKDVTENATTNTLIIARWVFFIFIFIGLISLIIPFMKLWTIVLVPQRVDSRTQKEYYERVENLLKNKKDNIEGDDGKINAEKKSSIFNEPEILPLNSQYNQPAPHQDIEMANIDGINKNEKKRRIGELKRRRNEDDN